MRWVRMGSDVYVGLRAADWTVKGLSDLLVFFRLNDLGRIYLRRNMMQLYLRVCAL
jgi:hypothetical protein